MDFVNENYKEIRNRKIGNERVCNKSSSAMSGRSEYFGSEQFVSHMPQISRDMDEGNNRVNRNMLSHRFVPRESMEVLSYTKRTTQEQVFSAETNIHHHNNFSPPDFPRKEGMQLSTLIHEQTKNIDESKSIVLGKTRVTKFYEKYGRFNGIVVQYNHPFYLIEYENGDCERVTHQQLLDLLEKTNENTNKKYISYEYQFGKGVSDLDIFHNNSVYPSGIDYRPMESNYYHSQYHSQAHHHLHSQYQPHNYCEERDHRDYQNPSNYHPIHSQMHQRHKFEQGMDQNKNFRQNLELSYTHEMDPKKIQQFDHESLRHHDPQNHHHQQQQYYQYYQCQQYPYQCSYQHSYQYPPQDQYGVLVNSSENSEMVPNMYDTAEVHQYSQQIEPPKESEEGDDGDDNKKEKNNRRNSSKKRKAEPGVVGTPTSKKPRGRPRKIAIENPLANCPLKKPLTAMKLFIAYKVGELKVDHPKEKKQQLTPIARQLWGELSLEEKSMWESKNKQLIEEYNQRLNFYLERKPDVREQLEMEKALKKKVRADYRRIARGKKCKEKNSLSNQFQQEDYNSPIYPQTSHQISVHHNSYNNFNC